MYLVDGEHVEVGYVVFVSILNPSQAFFVVDQFAHIFVHKLPLHKNNHNIKHNRGITSRC